MNSTALDSYFNKVFTKLCSGIATTTGTLATGTPPPYAYGREEVMPNLYFKASMLSSRTGNGFTLEALIASGSNATVVRSESFGPNSAAAQPWNSSALTSFYQAQMDAVYAALPIDTQAEFAQQYVAVKDFLSRGQTGVAQAIIANTPLTANLEATRAKLLTYL